MGIWGPLVAENRQVIDIITEGFLASAGVGIPALALGLFLGLVLGSIAGLTSRRWLDESLSLAGLSALSIPSFILGGLLILGAFPPPQLVSRRDPGYPEALHSSGDYAGCRSFCLFLSCWSEPASLKTEAVCTC